jgi:hypothetical protein
LLHFLVYVIMLLTLKSSSLVCVLLLFLFLLVLCTTAEASGYIICKHSATGCYDTILFLNSTEVHDISTRQNVNLFPPSTSFTKVQKGAYYSGIKIYNSRPKELKQLSNDQKSFEPALKRFLHVNSFYTLSEYFNYKC